MVFPALFYCHGRFHFTLLCFEFDMLDILEHGLSSLQWTFFSALFLAFDCYITYYCTSITRSARGCLLRETLQ